MKTHFLHSQGYVSHGRYQVSRKAERRNSNGFNGDAAVDIWRQGLGLPKSEEEEQCDARAASRKEEVLVLKICQEFR